MLASVRPELRHRHFEIKMVDLALGMRTCAHPINFQIEAKNDVTATARHLSLSVFSIFEKFESKKIKEGREQKEK